MFGTLYPAYSSYKAVKSKDVKEYVSILFVFLVMNSHQAVLSSGQGTVMVLYRHHYICLVI